MKHKLILSFALVLSGRLFAGDATNVPPQAATAVWRYINYPLPLPGVESKNAPGFLLTSVEQWQQVSRGLRLDILYVLLGLGFFKTNAITSKLYRANGEVVGLTPDGLKLLNAPAAISTSSVPGEEPAPQVMTYFPWGTNALQEAWMQITIGSE